METYQYFIHQGDIFDYKHQTLKTQDLSPWENINTNIITHKNQQIKKHVRLKTQNQHKTKYHNNLTRLKITCKNQSRGKQYQKRIQTRDIKRQNITTVNSPKQYIVLPNTKPLQQCKLNIQSCLVAQKQIQPQQQNMLRFKQYNQFKHSENLVKDRQSNVFMNQQNLPDYSKIRYKNQLNDIKIRRKTRATIKIEANYDVEWMKKYLNRKNPERHKNKQQLLYLPEVTKKLYEKYSFMKGKKSQIQDRIKLLPL